MFFSTPIQTASTLSAMASCGYASWRGGKVERWVAGLILIDWFGSPFLLGPSAFTAFQPRVFMLDGLVTLVGLVIALRSNRYWPLWVSALQILEILMHVAMAVDHHVRPRAYFVGNEITGYLILLALAVGVWLEAPQGKAWFPSNHKAVSTTPKP